jgi:predicted transcriptional regulator
MASFQLITAEDIRRLRKQFRLTQKKLAEKAGVSQSLIARIENKTVDPRLSTIKKIIDALVFTKEEKITAQDIMHTPVISIEVLDTVRKAVNLMKTHAISQLPVLDGEKVVGSIQESILINRLSKSKDVRTFFSTSVYNIMDKPFNSVELDTDIDIVINILSKGNPSVLVINRKKIAGIITKIDVLNPNLKKNKKL